MDGTLPIFHCLKLQGRGAPTTPWSWIGVDFLDHTILILKNSHQNLSIEGSNIFLSSLELGFQAAQTWAFFDELQILAGLSRGQKKQNSEFTRFAIRV
jgi:hypothetical protein